jgi:hypothetical protein
MPAPRDAHCSAESGTVPLVASVYTTPEEIKDWRRRIARKVLILIRMVAGEEI